MSEAITISKNVISKLALLQACGASSITYTIEETDTHWVLNSLREQELEFNEDFFRLCM